MKHNKLFLLSALAVMFCFSCKDKEPEPVYSERLLGWYDIAEQMYMNKPLDLNLDSIATTNLFDELSTDFRGDAMVISNLIFEPADYLSMTINVYSGIYGSWYQIMRHTNPFLLKIDNATESIEIVNRYNEVNYDINSEMYFHLISVEADGKRIKTVLNQNMLVWDWDLQQFKLENIDVTYVFRKREKGEPMP